jgi:hypothetical protein
MTLVMMQVRALALRILFALESIATKLDWTPRLRQPVKLHFAVRCRSIARRG